MVSGRIVTGLEQGDVVGLIVNDEDPCSLDGLFACHLTRPSRAFRASQDGAVALKRRGPSSPLRPSSTDVSCSLRLTPEETVRSQAR